jgi:hypothetical protein
MNLIGQSNGRASLDCLFLFSEANQRICKLVYCDGSVHSISPEIDMAVFVAGSTIGGGEVLSLPAE